MRKMVTVRTVTKVTKHPNADFLDICEVDGWNVITKLNEFQVGDKGFYFEIDSVVPTEDQRFAFLDNKAKHQILTNDKFERIEFRGFKIKTMKMKGVLSQGLLLPLSSINTKGKAVDPSKFKEDYDYAPAFKVIKFEPWLGARGNGQSKGNFPSIIQKTDQERCLSGETLIDTENGKMSIKDICESKYSGNVYSFNHETNTTEMKKVVDHSIMTNRKKEWLKIKTKSGKELIVTKNHKIFLPELLCYRDAESLTIGDKLLIL